jgi:glycosyltransferase involved in cell wall biosynthesis
MKIIHLTTVHPRDDSRIRSKMVAALHRRHPGQVALYVQDGLGHATDYEGFPIIDTGPRLRRLMRMSLGGWRMIRAVVKARPKVAHFHDPELLPWAAFLRLFGIKVVYDVHEDYPEAVAQNFRIPAIARRLLPPVVRVVEWVGARVINGIVTVTPAIAARFPQGKTVMVRNFPLVSEFHAPGDRPMRDRPLEVAYIGTITLNRNILGMINAVELACDSGAVLRLAGHFPVASDEAAARAHPGWERVKFDGWVSRQDIAEVLSSVRAGLVVLQPVDRFKLAYPIKLFEYMAAGVPVISSDFPLWREFVEKAGCGVLVDPMNPQAIADAIRWMIDDPDEAQAMGERGRRAVMETFRWESEVDTLFKFYEQMGIR